MTSEPASNSSISIVDEHDIWIAATALRYSLTVVSTDSDFERMRQVRAFNLESWVQS